MNDEINEIDVNIHSYLCELEDIFLEKINFNKSKVSECNLKINKLKESLSLSEKFREENDKHFSPALKICEEQNSIIKSEIDLLQLQLEEYNVRYLEYNAKNENLKNLDSYVKLLENKVLINSNINRKSYEECNKKNILLNGGYGDQPLLLNDEIAFKLLEAQEFERKRIARELHDTTVQNLTNLVHKTELCTKIIDIDLIRTKLELETMIGTIRNTINDMREIIYDLRPMLLDDLGLIITVQRFINQMMSHNKIKINFEVKNKEIIVLPVIKTTLFRIIQETLNNSLKHAKANNININLEYSEKFIVLNIKDDGIGFEYNDNENISNVNESKFGLSIMKERVYLLSGNIDINSSVDSGTQVNVRVPIIT